MELIDRRGALRTVPMKVLVLGFFRTGTSSMQVALETLGYKDTHHMVTVAANPLEADMWNEAINAKFFGKGKPYEREEWDQLLGHCQAVADAPSILFSEELIAAYPDAKVVLTNRDPGKWWKSYSESLRTIHLSKRVRLARWLDPGHIGKVLDLSQSSISIMLGGSWKDATEETAKAQLVAHYEKIRRIVPKERLLEYEVGEGWDRLCAFLGNEVPETAFPRLNDTKAIRQMIDGWSGQIFRRTVATLAVPAAVLISVCVAIYVRKYSIW
ncbi:P-loop containing nucleoside triphosphate hydrolase protein [Mycena latifolia]|nr:P-loop containing nucleoside triphosphate hydrolase protein [Mycena latifolia]